MIDNNGSAAKVLEFAKSERQAQNKRKSGINRNRFGSVRNVNGKVYMDFGYLGARAREDSGLPWNDQNKRACREALDKIYMTIKDGSFRFAEVFPESKKRDSFTALEKEKLKIKVTPKDVLFGDYVTEWFQIKEELGTVSGRTIREYRRYRDLYLIPFFSKKSFAQLNVAEFKEFVGWARKQRFKGLPVKHKSIKKYLALLKMICDDIAIKKQWTKDFNPFFGYNQFMKEMNNAQAQRNGDHDCVEHVFPFSIDEIRTLRKEVPDHWKPYFDFAFLAGLRPSEQIALKPEDIDWQNKTIKVRRAITLDEDGKRTEGNTKNEFSRRTIELTPMMLETLEEQRRIHEQFDCEYFFCTPTGSPVILSNLRKKVWIPALEKAGIEYRAIKQTRHTFATLALASGEDPSWIANVMGHCDTTMIIKTYAKYVKKATGAENGSLVNSTFGKMK